MGIFSARLRNEEGPESPRPSYSWKTIGNNFISRILNKSTKEDNNQQLDEIINVDKDIQIFQQNQLGYKEVRNSMVYVFN